MIQSNPLRQFFRRPAVYLKLPSGGKQYDASVVEFPESGELPVFPMTAIDDITARTPDALFNGTAVTDIISSCVPAIKNPWAISAVDLDTILIGIKIATNGDVMELDSICPKCNEVDTHGISLGSLLTTIKSGDYSIPLVIGDLTICFKPMSFTGINKASIDQFELQNTLKGLESIKDPDEQRTKSKEAMSEIIEMTMAVLTSTIASITTPSDTVEDPEFILDFLHNCDKSTYMKMRDFSTALREQSEIKPLPLKCPHCENEYEQPFTLNISDFFA